MGQNMSEQLMQMVKEGQSLIDAGFKIPEDNANWPEEILKWNSNCKRSLEAIYGKTKETKSFRTGSLENKVMVLKALASKEADASNSSSLPSITMNQNVSIHNEITNQLFLNIEYSIPKEQKEEVRELVKEVQEEVKKPQTNWNRVTELLKKGLDYGFKIGPDLVKLADAYYRAKGI